MSAPTGSEHPGKGNLPYDQQLRELDDSNRMLAADVKALADTISTVNALQIEQRRQQRENEETARRVTQVEKEADARIRRTRQTINLTTGALAVLLPLVSILVYLSLLNQVQGLLDQQARDRVTSCKQRNIGTQANIDRERKLASYTTDPRTAAAHTESANQLEKSIIDCDQYLKQVQK